MRNAISALVLAGVTTAAVVSAPGEARAQTMPMAHPGRISAFPQGMIGVGLLGAEAPMMIEGLVGVHNRWVLLISGAVGLVGGGIGGYFMDHAIDDAAGPSQVSTALLVAGMGLAIPTAIVFATATMYRPEEHQTEEAPANAAPLEESTDTGAPASGGAGSAPPAGAAGGSASRHRVRRALPDALVNLSPGHFELSVPALRLASSYTLEEMRQYNLAPRSEWHVPLFTARF